MRPRQHPRTPIPPSSSLTSEGRKRVARDLVALDIELLKQAMLGPREAADNVPEAEVANSVAA